MVYSTGEIQEGSTENLQEEEEEESPGLQLSPVVT